MLIEKDFLNFGIHEVNVNMKIVPVGTHLGIQTHIARANNCPDKALRPQSCASRTKPFTSTSILVRGRLGGTESRMWCRECARTEGSKCPALVR
jgi:hypothetical protein